MITFKNIYFNWTKKGCHRQQSGTTKTKRKIVDETTTNYIYTVVQPQKEIRLIPIS